MDGTPKGEEGRRQNLFPIGSFLMTQDTQHGVEVSVSPLHGVGLRIVGRGVGEANTSPLEHFLHCLRPEISCVVGVDLQGITKSRVKSLKGPQYLFAAGVAEGYGLEQLAEDILQGEEVAITLRACT